jgi:hypothetical protein
MSLLRELQQITERTYQKSSGINLEDFIIGRKRFTDLTNISQRETMELSDIARIFFRAVQNKLGCAEKKSLRLIGGTCCAPIGTILWTAH